jgi:hypothetical protein
MKNINKHLLIAMLLFLISTIESYSQLVVEAGPDQIACVNDWNSGTIILGGNPTASGGSGSYTYCWETLYHLPNSQYYWYASYFLDDTTSPNPKLIEMTRGSGQVFHLTVRDTENNIEVDSSQVISSALYQTLIEYTFYLQKDDSIYICYDNLIGSDLPIDSIAWIPQDGVSTPNATCTWVHPDSSTGYAVYIRNNGGCHDTSAYGYLIIIIPSAINNPDISSFQIGYSPQNQELEINGLENYSGPLKITLFNIDGDVLLKEFITGYPIRLSKIDLPLVIYTISDTHRTLYSGKLSLLNNY